MIAGSTPATARSDDARHRLQPERLRARLARSTSSAAAPSLMPDELPAVTRAVLRGTPACSFASCLERRVGARVLVGVDDGRLALAGRHRRPGTISSVEAPGSSCGGGPRWCDCEREGVLVLAATTPQRSATFSAVSPMRVRVVRSARRGLVKRQPSVVSYSVCVAAREGAAGLAITNGARVIDSTPPAMNTSPSPAVIALRRAALTACRPEPHSRLTVSPGDLDRQAGQQHRHAARRCGCPRRPGWRRRGSRRRRPPGRRRCAPAAPGPRARPGRRAAPRAARRRTGRTACAGRRRRRACARDRCSSARC